MDTTTSPLRLIQSLPSQYAQSVCASEIARALGQLEADQHDGCAWHCLRALEKDRLMAVAAQIVVDFLLDRQQAQGEL